MRYPGSRPGGPPESSGCWVWAYPTVVAHPVREGAYRAGARTTYRLTARCANDALSSATRRRRMPSALFALPLTPDVGVLGSTPGGGPFGPSPRGLAAGDAHPAETGQRRAWLSFRATGFYRAFRPTRLFRRPRTYSPGLPLWYECLSLRGSHSPELRRSTAKRTRVASPSTRGPEVPALAVCVGRLFRRAGHTKPPPLTPFPLRLSELGVLRQETAVRCRPARAPYPNARALPPRSVSYTLELSSEAGIIPRLPGPPESPSAPWVLTDQPT